MRFFPLNVAIAPFRIPTVFSFFFALFFFSRALSFPRSARPLARIHPSPSSRPPLLSHLVRREVLVLGRLEPLELLGARPLDGSEALALALGDLAEGLVAQGGLFECLRWMRCRVHVERAREKERRERKKKKKRKKKKERGGISRRSSGDDVGRRRSLPNSVVLAIVFFLEPSYCFLLSEDCDESARQSTTRR